MNYALVENGVVTNLISLHPMNADEFPDAVPTGDCPVVIGDTCTDGQFYRNGEQVKSHAELMAEEMADMQAALAELGVTVDE